MTFDQSRLLNTALEHLRGTPATAIALAAAVAAFAYIGVHGATPLGSSDDSEAARLPAIEAPPLLLREVDPQNALTINRRIPFARGPNPAAKRFEVKGDDTARSRALDCLTTAIYYEAATEPAEGQRAVAQVILNRVRHPAFAPSVCGVVYHGSRRVTGCQFSFTCDGSLRRKPIDSLWIKARQIASQALAGLVFEPVGYATHYHADYVVPYWATSLAKNAVVGRHIFYRWPQWWGTPAAFRRRHAGREPDPRLLRDLALRRPHIPQASAIASELVLEADPRVELMGVIQFLAAGTPLTEKSTPYEEEILLHFSRHAEHLAVQIYGQLAEGGGLTPELFLEVVLKAWDPGAQQGGAKADAALAKALGGRAKLQGFIAALRDFVTLADFEKFYGEQKPFYARLAADARKPAVAMMVKVADSDIPVHNAKIIVAPLLSNAAMSVCRAVPDKDPEAWLIVGVREGADRPFAKDKPFKNELAELSKGGCSKQVLSPVMAAR